MSGNSSNDNSDVNKILKTEFSSSSSSSDFVFVNHDDVCSSQSAATSKPLLKFDFNKLHPFLKRRFIEIATIDEKTILQKVSKSFDALINPEKYTIVQELIAHANDHYPLDHSFWNVNGYKTHIHPKHESHLEKLKNLIVNKKFNGIHLPENWITRCLRQNVVFFLTRLHLNDSILTHTEFKALCDFGALDSIYIENVTVEPSPKAAEIAMWTSNICRFYINIKNFECEKNWINHFSQFSNKKVIRKFEFKNLSPVFNVNDFDKFLCTRIISTKDQDIQPNVTVRISFAEHFIKNLKKKNFQSKLDQMFKGVFMRVPKVQYETFSSTDRFIVDYRYEEKQSRTYFFVNCRAIDALLKEIEDQKIAKSLVNLRV